MKVAILLQGKGCGKIVLFMSKHPVIDMSVLGSFVIPSVLKYLTPQVVLSSMLFLVINLSLPTSYLFILFFVFLGPDETS